MPHGISLSEEEQLLARRELPTVTTGGTSDEPVQNRGPDLWRRAPAADMKVDINTIQSNITSVDTMLADLQKMVLPKNMTRNQSVDLNTKIEKILNIYNDSQAASKNIADAFPGNAQAAKAMKTIVDQGITFGTALAQSKRPVNGDGTTLSANIKNVKSLLDPAKKAFKTLINIAQG
ncbi:hypothetical protein VP01_1260g6 [Puccinia sorghi]|uniref:Uncharacterized protein n=1 Tax=Puccinia sorghi TaxID=27349 RepID=A0A0L6VP78_9BASI|nr:hypothetical protein VP01_1260g6 [Puccinia sorghi]